MADMLVKLYDLPPFTREASLREQGVAIKRANIADKKTILAFVVDAFPGERPWVYECEYALFQNPITCHIAVHDKQIIGFACYDATAKGFFGPTGVLESFRGRGVGSALLFASLNSMRESGYAYAVIGWAGEKAVPFYQREVNAVIIEDSPPNKSAYRNWISME